MTRLPGQLARYGLASGVALAVDWGLMIGLTEVLGAPYLLSAAAGFSVGVLVAYVLSLLFVFDDRRWADARIEFALFTAVGVAGLVLNHSLLYVLVERLGAHYALAKAPAAVGCFLFNFLVRRSLLFSGQHSRPQPA